MKKILFVTPSLAGGGMEKQLKMLLDGINRQYCCQVISYIKNRDNIKLDKIKLIRIYKKNKIDFVFFLKIFVYIMKQKPDVLFSTINGSNKYCQIIGNLLCIPVICSIRSTNEITYYRKLGRIHKWFPVTYLICNCEKAKRQILENTTINEKQIKVIYNAIRFKYVNVITRKKETKLKLAYIGRIVKEKNLLDVIKALKIVKNINIHLYVVGMVQNENYYKKCIEYTKKEKLGNKVSFENHKNEIPEFLHTIDGVVIPSEREGLSNVLIETMAAGIPCIVSTNADPELLINENVNGYRYDTGNVEQLAEKIGKIDNIMDVKRVKAWNEKILQEKFNLEKMVEKYNQIFESIFGKKQ